MRGIELEPKYEKHGDELLGLTFHRDGMYVAGSHLDSTLTVRNLYKTIGYDTIALAFMLQVTHTECGGSVINNRGWRDEDDEEKMMTSDAPILTVSSNSACLT